MNTKPVLALVLAAALPGNAFAQTVSAAATASQSGVSGAVGTALTIPQLGGGLTFSLSAPSIGPSLTLVPNITLGAMSAPAALTPSAMAPVKAAASTPEALKPSVSAAKIEAAKPAAGKTVPSALKPVLSAASKDEGPGKEKGEPEAGASELFDGAKNLKAFVVQHGKPMVEVPLSQLASHRGQIRLLTAKNDPTGVTSENRKDVAAMLGAKVQREEISIDWSPKGAAASAPAAAGEKTKVSLKSVLLWPVREAKFLGKSFKQSLVKPEASEVVGGIVTKSFPLVTAIGVYWATAGLAHPFVFAALVGLSLAQEVFHGIFLKSWNNFQEIIFKARGFNYQVFFNFAYVQIFGTMYRGLSWIANPASVTPPWSTKYWQDMAVMSVVGTFFGVLGYNALNELYNKGVIKRWQHSGIQQLRDLAMLLSAPFFASGSMTVFWTIFVVQQLFDLAIAIWAGRAKARPVVFVVSDAVAASPEFRNKYPTEGAKVEPPLKSAMKAVVDNPFIRLLTWPARALWKAVRRTK